jgi:septum formation protein
MPALILASTSPYRRLLLERLRLPFEVVRPEVAEDAVPGETPIDRAGRLSLAKATAVAHRHPGAIVIGSDQVAALGDRVLDKPGDAATCREQLAALSGRTAHFFTGCAVGNDVHIDTTSVVFRRLGAEEIARYVDTERPFDCAGGFKVEALGISLFERVDSSDPTALIGLPLIPRRSLRLCSRDEPMRSITALSSGGSGALALNELPCGQSKLTLCACRNMRFSPSAFRVSLNSSSPYFSSPATG